LFPSFKEIFTPSPPSSPLWGEDGGEGELSNQGIEHKPFGVEDLTNRKEGLFFYWKLKVE
jgi:hypothetical protein